MKALAWSLSRFDALSPQALYALLQLRSEVFVLEQGCAFQDLDGMDAQATHLLGHSEADRALQAYARCMPPGVKYTEASIGRIVIRASSRGAGVGHFLVRKALECVASNWGVQPIRIGAQARLEGFYRQHGFVPDGALYDEDGIAHIEMFRDV